MKKAVFVTVDFELYFGSIPPRRYFNAHFISRTVKL